MGAIWYKLVWAACAIVLSFLFCAVLGYKFRMNAEYNRKVEELLETMGLGHVSRNSTPAEPEIAASA